MLTSWNSCWIFFFLNFTWLIDFSKDYSFILLKLEQLGTIIFLVLFIELEENFETDVGVEQQT